MTGPIARPVRVHPPSRAPAQPAMPAGNKQRHQRLLQRVRTGDIKYARKLTHTRTLIVLDDAGREVAFIYSSREKQIINFLPAPVAYANTEPLRGGQQ